MRLAEAFSLILLCALTACTGQAPRAGVGEPAAQVNATPTADYSGLRDTHWALVSLDGHDLIAGSVITLELDAGLLSGESGCNKYGTVQDAVYGDSDDSHYYATADGRLTIPNLFSTAMDCAKPVGVMEQETQYFAILKTIRRYVVAAGELTLMDWQDVERLKYTVRQIGRADVSE